MSFGGSGGGSSSISGSSDVALNSAGDGQMLAYNTALGKWQNQTVPLPPPASPSTSGIVELSNDLGGSATAPTVVATHLAAPLPLNQGGTGSASQNFVDLTTGQSVAGAKTFSTSVATPSLQVSGGVPAVGKVLTSDATGNASWLAPVVTSVATRTGAVVLAASDVGLGNVDNTSDATKNAATAILTNKTISGASNTLSSIPETAVTNLTTDLAAKVPTKLTVTSDQPAPGYWQDLYVNYAPGTSAPEPIIVNSSASGTKYRVFWLNENGAPRAAASQIGEASLKIYGFQGGGQAVPLTIWYDKWSINNILYAINADGTPAIGRGSGNSVAQGSHTIVLGPSDTVPSGIPAGTVIVRKVS